MIWVVMATRGEYSDRTVWAVRAHRDELAAREFAERASAWAREQHILHDKAGRPDDDPRWPWEDYHLVARHPEYPNEPVDSGYTTTYDLDEVELHVLPRARA